MGTETRQLLNFHKYMYNRGEENYKAGAYTQRDAQLHSQSMQAIIMIADANGKSAV